MFKRDLEKVLGGSIARVDTRRGQDIYGVSVLLEVKVRTLFEKHQREHEK